MKDGLSLVRSVVSSYSTSYALLDEVLMSPQISGIPLLLLANKQDAEGSLTVEEIRENHEEWWVRKQSSMKSPGMSSNENDTRRMGSLEVMGISALKGLVFSLLAEFLLTLC